MWQKPQPASGILAPTNLSTTTNPTGHLQWRLQDVVDILQNIQANHNNKINHITKVVEELSQGLPAAAAVHTPEGTATADPHETPRASRPLGVAFDKDVRMGKKKSNVKQEDDNNPWHSVSDSGDKLPNEPTPGVS
ncbi:hypothetical protein BN14_07502 [Rhizoctonia solani AG-1 IB]|uniref:Uncharacterized protein n=1 Tax=Thanatephorus cucumeris (strain AG1-IB / isolate 7/3/14) TaxID=1108050 RepID=M5CC51_THACB|nr:hypothetical protein BN14_07502 [Rhizoctonia solani AG-1 IB]